ncbi:MAG TPA: hypothetical protein VH207_04100 [Chthoniobacterales bacterium]|nr:hypothetical protein [Chthoniobacterales bacterium]
MADLDLSPRADSYELEGVSMPQLSFYTGTNKDATYQPPSDWSYSGGHDHLDLQPEGINQAMARISKWPAEPALAFDSEGLVQLRQRIIALLPQDSVEVEVRSEEMNPLQIDGKQTYLVELSYTCYGERYACYCLVLDRKPKPICFRLTCRESDYEALRPAFHRSLFTWQNL